MLDEEADDLFVTVTGCPEERVPAVSLAGGRGLFGEPVGGFLVVVFLAGLEEKLVLLLLLQFLLYFLFFIIVIASAGPTSCGKYLIFRLSFCHRC